MANRAGEGKEDVQPTPMKVDKREKEIDVHRQGGKEAFRDRSLDIDIIHVTGKKGGPRIQQKRFF